MVLRQGLGPAGMAIGLAAGAIASQAVRSLLFGVGAMDPVTFGGGALLFFAVAFVACVAPQRATRIDAIVTLRAE